MHPKVNRIIKTATPWLFLLPFVGMYLAFSLFPLGYSFFLSLNKWNGIGPMEYVGMSNYVKLLTSDPYFWLSIKNSLILGLGYAPLQIFVALVLAVMISHPMTKAKSFFQTSVFLPHITASVAVGVIFSILFSWKDGAVNHMLIGSGLIDKEINWLGQVGTSRFVVMLILYWKDLGYLCVLFMAGLAGIPHDFYEAAEIDGAGPIGRFFRITLPMLKPVLLFVIINNISWIFQIFDEPFMLFTGRFSDAPMLLGGPKRSSLTAIWNMYDTAFGGTMRYSYASAIAYLLFAIILMFSALSFYLSNRKEGD